MDVIVKNLTSTALYLSLHSGQNLRLPPRGASPPISEVEVKDNARLQKLEHQRMIEIVPATRGPAEKPAASGDEADDRPRTRKKS